MTTLTLQPAAAAGIDTMLNSIAASQGYNYGTTIQARVGTSTAAQQRRMLLAFDISSMPAGATITAATLTLNCSSEDGATDYDVAVHRALLQWYEGTKNGAAPDGGTDGSTWNNRNENGPVAWGAEGGASGTDYAASATATTTITGTGNHTWDVLADVSAWYAGTATNYGWFIINTSEATTNSGKIFDTSDNSTAGNRPKLVIEYTVAGKPGHFMYYQRMRK